MHLEVTIHCWCNVVSGVQKVAKFVEAGSSFENGTLATEPSKVNSFV